MIFRIKLCATYDELAGEVCCRDLAVCVQRVADSGWAIGQF